MVSLLLANRTYFLPRGLKYIFIFIYPLWWIPVIRHMGERKWKVVQVLPKQRETKQNKQVLTTKLCVNKTELNNLLLLVTSRPYKYHPIADIGIKMQGTKSSPIILLLSFKFWLLFLRRGWESETDFQIFHADLSKGMRAMSWGAGKQSPKFILGKSLLETPGN